MTLRNAEYRADCTQRATAALAAARDAATQDQIDRGRQWYSDANALGGTTTYAGILAALSPQVPWDVNVRNAEDFALYGELRRSDGYFTTQLRKASAIRDGADPDDVLRGRKERAFYASIIGHEREACIDRHMIYASGLDWPTLTDARYSVIADATATVAARHCEPVRETQAIIWLVQREATTPNTTAEEIGF